jgi:hypothetical protein
MKVVDANDALLKGNGVAVAINGWKSVLVTQKGGNAGGGCELCTRLECGIDCGRQIGEERWCK